MKLTKMQKKVFDEYRPKLRGTFSDSKKQRLEAFAIERSRWVEAEKKISSEGSTLILRDDKGAVSKVIENPALKLAERAQDRSLKLAKDLGI